MLKKCLIVCWYGPLPDYFKVWEETASRNDDYDFFVFTDQTYASKYSNIKVTKLSLNELKDLFSKKLNIECNITKAYKLCDYKPTYGAAFSDYIKDYDYWGYCDIDVVWGKISDFIKDDEIARYERINHYGHFCLYKNNEKMINLYKAQGSLFNYKEVLESNLNYAFDETRGMDYICAKNNINMLDNNDYAEINRRYSRYILSNHNNFQNQIFVFENGNLARYVYEEGKMRMQDKFIYLHFQKKRPKIYLDGSYDKIAIGKNGIFNYSGVNEELIQKVNPSSNAIAEKFEKFKYDVNKVISYLKMNKKEKEIARAHKIG